MRPLVIEAGKVKQSNGIYQHLLDLPITTGGENSVLLSAPALGDPLLYKNGLLMPKSAWTKESQSVVQLNTIASAGDNYAVVATTESASVTASWFAYAKPENVVAQWNEGSSSFKLNWTFATDPDKFYIDRSATTMNPASMPAPIAEVSGSLYEYYDSGVIRSDKPFYRIGYYVSGVLIVSDEYGPDPYFANVVALLPLNNSIDDLSVLPA